MVDPDGYYLPVDEKYADQKKVYEEIGSDILVNAWYTVDYSGRAITAVFSPMDRQAQASPTLCWGMEAIRASSPSSVILCFRKLRTRQTRRSPTKSRSA